MAETELRLSDEMISRGAQVLHDLHGSEIEKCRKDAAAVILAVFRDVPLTNYGIGLALQFFDMLICVKENVGGGAFPRAGVYVSDGPDGFTSLGHALDVSWGHKPSRHLRSVRAYDIDRPEA